MKNKLLLIVVIFLGIVLVGCATDKEVIDNDEVRKDNEKTAETMVPPKEETAKDILISYLESYKHRDYEKMADLVSEGTYIRSDKTKENFITSIKELEFKNDHKLKDYMISVTREIDSDHVYFKVLHKYENNGVTTDKENDLVVLKENGEWKIDMASRFSEEELDLSIEDGHFVLRDVSIIKTAREYGEDTTLFFDIGSILPVVSLKFNYNTIIEIDTDEGNKYTSEASIQSLDYNYLYTQSATFNDTSGNVDKITLKNITMIDEYGDVMSYDELLDITFNLEEGKVITNLDLKGISKEEAKDIAQGTLDKDSAGHLYSITNIEDGENGYWIAEFKHDISGSGYKMRINKFTGNIKLHIE